MTNLRVVSLIALVSMFVQPFAAFAAEMPTFSSFEMTGVSRVIASETEDLSSGYVYGSAMAGDFIGNCVITTAGLVLDGQGAAMPYIFVVQDAGTEQEMMYAAKILVADANADIAYVCIQDENFTGTTLRHYFTGGQVAMDALKTGDGVVAIGFSSAEGIPSGEASTVSGTITNFTPVSGERDLLSTDIVVAPGIAGGPLLTADKQVVGMVSSITNGTTSEPTMYGLSTDYLSYFDTESWKAIAPQLEEAGVYSSDCVYTPSETSTASFVKDGKGYYDMACLLPQNIQAETAIRAQYEYWCGADIGVNTIGTAARTLIDPELQFSFEDWHTYLSSLCKAQPVTDTQSYFSAVQDLGASLIKGADSDIVYAVLHDGKRHPFANEAAYYSWYGDFADVETVSAEALASYVIGTPVELRPGTMVKTVIDPRVYMITDDFQLRWIEDEATAAALYGENWNTKVLDLPEYLLLNYGKGEDVKV